MSFVVIFLMVVGALFAVAFLTRRRFGVLGLALAAGAMLSNMWVGDLTPIVANAGFVVVRPPLSSLVSAALILLPAVVLLTSGPTYKTMLQRVVGALAFAMLATALLLEPLESALVIDGIGRGVHAFFVENRSTIITVGLVMAIGDLLLAKTPKFNRKSKE